MNIRDILSCGGGGLFLLSIIIQIAPIEINPWSWIARKIGNAINGDIIKKLDEQGKKLEEQGKKIDELEKRDKEQDEKNEEKEALAARRRILRFSDEIRRKLKHSSEYFDNVLDDITSYKNYCDSHKGFKNEKAVSAIELIKITHKRCLDENDFL